MSEPATNVSLTSYTQRNTGTLGATEQRKATMEEPTVITFQLFGVPSAKSRPRFYNGRAVTDAKTKEAEQSILAAYLVAVGQREPHDGAVTVDFVATFAAAPSWAKWRRNLATAGHLPHTARPDLDNLVKILDGLNGVAWIDDSQIVAINAVKQYGATASTHVTLHLHPTPTKEQQ